VVVVRTVSTVQAASSVHPFARLRSRRSAADRAPRVQPTDEDG